MEKFIKIVRFGHFQIWKYNQNLQAFSSKIISSRSEIVDGKVQNEVLKTCTPGNNFGFHIIKVGQIDCIVVACSSMQGCHQLNLSDVKVNGEMALN